MTQEEIYDMLLSDYEDYRDQCLTAETDEDRLMAQGVVDYLDLLMMAFA